MPDLYVDLPIEFDQESLQDDAIAYVQDKVPGLVLDPAHPETWIIEAVARMAAEVAFVASQVPAATIRVLGESLYGIARGEGLPAIASTVWTAVDSNGHTIPAGTVIVIDDVPFATDSDATIPNGQTSVSDVAVTALEVGTFANDLGTQADSITAFVWLDSVTVFGTTSGGEDAETDKQYQDRLVGLLSLQAPRPITARDFQAFAIQYSGVARALALDGYNPAATNFTGNTSNGSAVVTSVSSMTGITEGSAITGTGIPANTTVLSIDSGTQLTLTKNATATGTGVALTSTGTYDNERTTTVVPIDSNGDSITTTNPALATKIKNDLEAQREVNFVVNVLGATYTTVTVAYTAKAYSDFDLTTLTDDVDAAIEAYLAPSAWGTLPYGEDTLHWENTTVVRLNKIIQVIENVPGVKYVETVTLNGSAADLTLPGAAPLPKSDSSASGTITY